MATLNFEKVYSYSDTDVSHSNICNEPDNTLNRFSVKNDREYYETNGSVSPADYDSVDFNSADRLLTSHAITNIGVKTFPQIGSIGFYTLKHNNNSLIVAPIFTNSKKYEAPTCSVDTGTDTITINIVDPEDVVYTCYRVVIVKSTYADNEFTMGNLSDEYITYDKSISIPKPSKGIYTVFLYGYIDERLASAEYELPSKLTYADFALTTYGASGKVGPTQEEADAALATVTIFNGIQKYTVEESGTYYLEACGGAGGRGGGLDSWVGVWGGFGAIISGTFDLLENDELYILVGQKGVDNTQTSSSNGATGAGGGATYIAIKDDTSTDVLNIPASDYSEALSVNVRLLICAGAGNGGSDSTYTSYVNANALLTEGTDDSYLTTSYSGGGYSDYYDSQYCGTSFLEGGAAATYNYSRYGTSYPGFGGGGSNYSSGYGGGGGGYRGGVPGVTIGGSSYNACTTGSAKLNTERTDGYVNMLKI